MYFESGDAEGFRLLDRVVEWSQEAGLYVVIDMHCAPGGQTGANIDDGWGYPWLFESPEAQQLNQHLEAHRSALSRFGDGVRLRPSQRTHTALSPAQEIQLAA